MYVNIIIYLSSDILATGCFFRRRSRRNTQLQAGEGGTLRSTYNRSLPTTKTHNLGEKPVTRPLTRDRQAIHDDLPAPIGSRHLTRPRRTLPQHPATWSTQVASRPAYRVYDLRPVLSMRTEESTGEENTTLGATVRVERSFRQESRPRIEGAAARPETGQWCSLISSVARGAERHLRSLSPF